MGIDLGLRGGFGVGGTTGAEEGGFAALGGSGGRFGTGWWIWSWRIRVWGCEGGFEPRRVDLGLDSRFGAERMNYGLDLGLGQSWD